MVFIGAAWLKIGSYSTHANLTPLLRPGRRLKRNLRSYFFYGWVTPISAVCDENKTEIAS